MPSVLITGGTGLVGRHLTQRLLDKGFEVAILSRSKKKIEDVRTYKWDVKNNRIEKGAIEGADYIVHLAGANIGDKGWSESRKQLIIDSRVKTGQLILSTVHAQRNMPKAFISASGIGYYGAVTSDKVFSETDPSASDFLGETCRQWEQITDRFKELGLRTVKIRIGVVLSKEGGALSKMKTPVNWGVGCAIGSGNQYMPWIHIDDLCDIFIDAIENTEMRGAYNAAAPDQQTNKEFTRTLAGVLNKPFWFPKVPAIMMQLIFGEMADILLKGSRVSIEKLKSTGFNFKFPELKGALTNLLKNQ